MRTKQKQNEYFPVSCLVHTNTYSMFVAHCSHGCSKCNENTNIKCISVSHLWRTWRSTVVDSLSLTHRFIHIVFPLVYYRWWHIIYPHLPWHSITCVQCEYDVIQRLSGAFTLNIALFLKKSIFIAVPVSSIIYVSYFVYMYIFQHTSHAQHTLNCLFSALCSISFACHIITTKCHTSKSNQMWNMTIFFRS